jgi:ribose/xylose/arabinose/galactoside ABC-type transport system permease subunit
VPDQVSTSQLGQHDDDGQKPRGAWIAPLLTRFLIDSGFVPVWLATAALLIIAAIIAPETLSNDSLSSAVLPFTAFLAIAALGEMLVIMTGGIDLSIPGVIVLVANVVVGVSGSEDGGLAWAIVVCLGLSALVGLVNGILVGVVGLNSLIVTLAIGGIVTGITVAYATTIANESEVPPALSTWVTHQYFGVASLFWVGLAVSIALAVVLRFTTVGRRFQLVGANQRAAWVAGIRVERYVVSAYVGAALLYGGAGILLAGFIRSPSIDLGDPYLLGPIAAVVIGGASLTGGLASPLSTWAAAFALTFLSQMLRVLGLSTALQFVVFGVAIAAGMVISGDRIVGLFGGLLQREQFRTWIGADGVEAPDSPDERREGISDSVSSA